MRNSSSVSQPAEQTSHNPSEISRASFLSSRLGVIVLFLGFNYTLMGTVIYPALPGIQAQFHLSAAQLSLMASLPALVSISFQPLVGWISDHIDRKVIVGLGLLAYILGGSLVGSILVSAVTSYLLVLVGRTFSGLGELGAFPHYLAIIHEKLPPGSQQRMVGIMESLTSLGSVMAPMIGGALAAVSLAFPFYATSIFGLIALALALWALPSLKPIMNTPRKAAPRKFEFHFSFLGGSLIMGTLVSISTFLGSYSQSQFGFNSTQIGFLIAVTPLAMAGGAALAGRHGNSGYLPTRNLLVAGITATAGLALVGLVQVASLTIVGLTATGAALGYWLTAFDHDAMSFGDPETRGLRLSVFQQAKSLGILCFPFLLGVVIDVTGSIRLIYFLLAAALFIVGMTILQIRGRYEKRREPLVHP